MWHIVNPHVLYKTFLSPDKAIKFQLNSLMRIEKFNSFPEADRNALLNLTRENYLITDVEFKNPDNPAQLLRGKLITFKVY